MTPILRWVAALALVASPAPAWGGGVVAIDTTDSPHAVVRPVAIGDASWTDGFWAQRALVNRERSIPSMWELMRGTRHKPFLQHFYIAAGKAEGDYHGAAWNDGDFYKWLEAASVTLAVAPTPELRGAVDESVRAITAAQRADGYLHTPTLIRNRNGDASARPFAERNDFEVYNMGHLMTAGAVHFRATGRRELLAAGEKAAAFLEGAFAHPTPELARNAVCPSHYMGLVELHRATGEARWLRLAERLLAMRDLVSDGGDDNQDRVPLAQQREVSGHAVRANYLYAGVADLALETGDASFRPTLEAVWRNLVDKKLYVTGGCGALFDGASPDGSPDQGEITRIHQAYGRNYQLPGITAHNETCAAIGAVLWGWRMFLATGDAEYVDLVELALHNAVLAGVSLEGTDYFYTNPLRVVRQEPVELRWSRVREPFIVSFCCPPNVVRTIAETPGYAYSVSKGAVWVNLYGGSELATRLGDQPLRLTQETAYPWDGMVRIVLKECPAAEFALRLRIPGWARGANVLVNGEPARVGATPGEYAEVRRAWRRGDTLELRLPMPVEVLEAHPLVEETRNQVALKRGPIVYCLESPDLPTGVAVADVVLPMGAELTPRFESGLLGGVSVIRGRVLAQEPRPWNSLYRPARGGPTDPPAEREVEAVFVPYFAWGNRGPSEMSVWLPRR